MTENWIDIGSGYEILVQGSEAWRMARVGSLGASRVGDATGTGATRATLLNNIIDERITGIPTRVFVNEYMQWGTDTEPAARDAYEFMRSLDVVQVGLYRHPTIKGTHASPDGLVGEDGMIEIKCPTTRTHRETITSRKMPKKHMPQVQWQMEVCGRQWVDFISFDPRVRIDKQIFIERIERDSKYIAKLTSGVKLFLEEVDRAVAEFYGVESDTHHRLSASVAELGIL